MPREIALRRTSLNPAPFRTVIECLSAARAWRPETLKLAPDAVMVRLLGGKVEASIYPDADGGGYVLEVAGEEPHASAVARLAEQILDKREDIMSRAREEARRMAGPRRRHANADAWLIEIGANFIGIAMREKLKLMEWCAGLPGPEALEKPREEQ